MNDPREQEIARLRAQLATQAQSALLQATRATGLEMQARRYKRAIDVIRSSTIWRLASPLRVGVHVLKTGPRNARRLAGLVAREGWASAASRVRRRLQDRPPERRLDPAAAALYAAPPSRPATSVVAPRVLIIAELSLPQCAKYRVWQKQAHFTRLGTACTVVDCLDIEAARSALQIHALAIFYRVPGRPKTLALIEEARRLGVTSYWEADDLIFDLGHYKANRNLDTLRPALRAEVLAGVDLFRAAMLACDRTIASTASLAARMAEAGAGPSLVIENALDQETLAIADALHADARPMRDEIVIMYGSGSKAHDADFNEAAPALAEVMRARPLVRLRLVGDLTLPPALDGLNDRIDRLPGTSYRAFLGLLAEADISLAPLEPTVFNEAKSNIKFIEAAVLGLPSVCSPRSAFRDVIEDGADGLLADDTAAWRDALLRLVDDPGLCRRVGTAARATVLARYAPAAIAEAQVAPLVRGLDARVKRKLRVLAVNIFFAPLSFGGATIVAEQMAQLLAARDDTEMYVFTAREEEDATPYQLLRYEWGGIPVIVAQIPSQDPIAEFDNPEMARVFADVLRAVEPDVVHIHCVQHLGAGLLRTCEEVGIPFVVTIHDAWWLCARQFMVRDDTGYCFQRTIDLNVCQVCVPGIPHVRQRFSMLASALSGATLVLSPSEAHRQLYLANGFDPARTLVNHNGIRLPHRPRARRPGAAPRFGYLGGRSGLKGYPLVQAAFAAITGRNYELVLVDNTLNLGFSSIDPSEWRIAGKLTVVPAYRQDGMDDFFDGIDVLLFPSQWKESFGLVVAEALARDVWVIVTEGGGAAEFVVEGENGTKIPLRNDPAPLQAAIEALLLNPERLRGHVNPYKADIVGYADQAEELHGLLVRAALRHPDPLPPGGRGVGGFSLNAPAVSG